MKKHNKVRVASGDQLTKFDAKRPFFSVIMPVFNAEETLNRAIASVISQTFKKFELIIIDNCSTDGSYDLMMDWARRDFRIQLLQTSENNGVSPARNLGLERISGTYVTFIDADDWLEPNIFDVAAKSLMEDPSIDCLKYSCHEEYFDSQGELQNRIKCICGEATLTNRQQIVEKIVELESIPLFGYVWNGFYRTQILQKHQLKFNTEMRVNEDFDFNLEFLRHLYKIKTINELGYHYSKQIGSLSTHIEHYSYPVLTAKIRGLLSLFEYGLPADQREKIFWMYVRACYSALTNANVMSEVMDEIESDPLFREFRLTKFNQSNFKQKIMISLLKFRPMRPILILAIIAIRIVRKFFPNLFASVKR